MPTDPPLARVFDAPSSRPRYRRRRWSGMALVMVVAVGACSSGPPSSGAARAMPDQERAQLRAPGAAATLSNLTGLDQLQTLFDEHQDVPRLILLLSPT